MAKQKQRGERSRGSVSVLGPFRTVKGAKGPLVVRQRVVLGGKA